MNKTKKITTTPNYSLEDFIIKNNANGWLLQIAPSINNYLQDLTSKFTNYFTALDLRSLLFENDKLEGTVKFYDKTKRFGFITTDKEDIFVHISGLKDKIRQNDEVIFEIENGKNGLNAVNVRLLHNQN